MYYRFILFFIFLSEVGLSQTSVNTEQNVIVGISDVRILERGLSYRWYKDGYFNYQSNISAVNVIKELPKDIDIVVFIHHEAFQMHLPILRKLQSQFAGAIDFYFEPSYPVGHKLHPVFEILKNDWQQLYSHTRRHPETMKIHQKGFLEINPDSIF